MTNYFQLIISYFLHSYGTVVTQMYKDFFTKYVNFFVVSVFLVVGIALYSNNSSQPLAVIPLVSEEVSTDPYTIAQNWVRQPGPATVALQVGHWKNSELPQELSSLIGNTGAQAGGVAEWEVNLTIAEETKKILESQGVVVEILPATVPPRYLSDVFLAIHADGNEDTRASGYKFAGPRRDLTSKSSMLVEYLDKSYAAATQLQFDPNITRNMRGYYAFAWWRYEHAVHPMTTAAIAETGFLTNPNDRKIIVAQSKKSAAGLAHGILQYLYAQKLIERVADLEVLMLNS